MHLCCWTYNARRNVYEGTGNERNGKIHLFWYNLSIIHNYITCVCYKSHLVMWKKWPPSFIDFFGWHRTRERRKYIASKFSYILRHLLHGCMYLCVYNVQTRRYSYALVTLFNGLWCVQCVRCEQRRSMHTFRHAITTTWMETLSDDVKEHCK